MSRITEELTAEYVNSILQYGREISDMVKDVETKGRQIAETINTLEELEGRSDIEDRLYILKECPMVPVLDSVKKVNAQLIGEEILPDFYPKIVEEYIAERPDDCAILHPLCIAHQVIRKTFGDSHGLKVQQIACRSGSTGKVVFSEKGLTEASMTEEEAKEKLADNACLYLVDKK